MASVRQWDSLLGRMGTVGRAGALPKQTQQTEKLVDELQRRLSLMEEVTRELVAHVRSSPDFPQIDTDLEFGINYDDVGTVNWNGTSIDRAVLLSHGQGYRMTRFVITSITSAKGHTWDDPVNGGNDAYGGAFRLFASDENANLFTVDENFITNQLRIAVVLYRQGNLPLNPGALESASAISAFGSGPDQAPKGSITGIS